MTERKNLPESAAEGRRLRSLDPYNAVTPFIMRERRDATNFFSDSVEMTEIDRFIRKKRAEGFKGFGFLHLFIAAYVRTVSRNPAINRYVSGRRIYARNGIDVIMTIKKEMTVAGQETSVKIRFSPYDTAEDVYRRVNSEVKKAREETANGTDKTANLIAKLPRFMLSFFMFVVRTTDYYGRMPKALKRVSPFHGSLVLTDLGSLGIPPVYHHLYDFGNVPIFIAFGAKRRVWEAEKDGSAVLRKYLDYTVASDERICDGYYFARALKFMRSLMLHPETLETPPEFVLTDVN